MSPDEGEEREEGGEVIKPDQPRLVKILNMQRVLVAIVLLSCVLEKKLYLRRTVNRMNSTYVVLTDKN